MIFELEFSRIYLIAFAAGSASEAQPTMARPAHTAERASNFSALLKRVFFSSSSLVRNGSQIAQVTSSSVRVIWPGVLQRSRKWLDDRRRCWKQETKAKMKRRKKGKKITHQWKSAFRRLTAHLRIDWFVIKEHGRTWLTRLNIGIRLYMLKTRNWLRVIKSTFRFILHELKNSGTTQLRFVFVLSFRTVRAMVIVSTSCMFAFIILAQ